MLRHPAKPYRKEAHRQLHHGAGIDELRRGQADATGTGGVAADQERVAANSLLREVIDTASAKDARALGKTLMLSNPIESIFLLVRQGERNIKRKRSSAMLQR